MTEPKRVIVEYTIVTGSDKLFVIGAINNLIEEGWEIYKSLSISIENGKPFYAQAMVRKEEEDTRGAWG